MTAWQVIHCDGRPAHADDLAALALVNDGHFTTLQVRAGAVQGLELHVGRLRDASRCLFGADEAPERIHAAMRAALAAAGCADATLRITLFPQAPGTTGATTGEGVGAHQAGDAVGREAAQAAGGGEPGRAWPGGGARTRILVAVGAPLVPDARPLRLRSYRFVRHLPGIKHVGTFPLFHHRRLARAAGFDDALFVDAADHVCEGSVWNLALWDGARVLWPRGPALRGTRERLLQAAFAAMCVPQVEAPVPLDALASLAGLACNARGVQPLAAVDGRPMRDCAPLLALAAEAATRTPWQPIPGDAEASPTAAACGRL